MKNCKNFCNIIRLLLCTLVITFTVISNSYAGFSPLGNQGLYDGSRDCEWKKKDCGTSTEIMESTITNCKTGRCDVGEMEFDPLGENIDVAWDLLNPVCASMIAFEGAAMTAASIAARVACTPTNSVGQAAIPVEKAQEVAIPPGTSGVVVALTAVEQVMFATRCATRSSEASYWNGLCAAPTPEPGTCTQATAANKDAAGCCLATGAYPLAVGVYLGSLAVIHDIASQTFENATICGLEEVNWEKVDGIWMKVRSDERNDLIESYINGDKEANIKDKQYREFVFGGQEYEDNGEGACGLPDDWGEKRRNEILGYSDGKQRYYLNGPGGLQVFACERFLNSSKKNGQGISTGGRKSYDCCKKRSQRVVCIENETKINALTVNDVTLEALDIDSPFSGREYKFCEVGKTCEVANVFFDIYESRDHYGYVCAKTYSLCPYNHYLGGGTEKEFYKDLKENDGVPELENYCQYMKHCAKLPLPPYFRTTGFTSAFISKACRDLRGDSQNFYGFSGELSPLDTRSFSAPMAQCFKETMENIFLNKAGHTECIGGEAPNEDGECSNGYLYKEGEEVSGDSFFVKIQNNLKDIIRLGLILSVVVIGYQLLLATQQTMNRKKILSFLIKIGLVMYFAVGDGWWQHNFINGVFNTSTFLSELTFRPVEDLPKEKLDGCQFPKFNYADDDEDTTYDNPQYPKGKEYLKIWDTFDCKIARALGYGPDVSVPNLALLIIGGLFTGGLGVIFFVAGFLLAFLLLSVVVRALHMFLIATTAIILLMYVSPITITMAMFERTKPIFDQWWKKLLGYVLQPMILFAYLGILIVLIDKTVIGDVTFKGSGRNEPKSIVCEGEVEHTSPYCLFRIADIKTFTGLEPIGIGIPMLASFDASHSSSIIKMAIILFIFLQFMDKINYFALKLVGGDDLSSNWGVKGIASTSYKTLKGIQERGYKGIYRQIIPGIKNNLAAKVGRGVRDATRAVTRKKPSASSASRGGAT